MVDPASPHSRDRSAENVPAEKQTGGRLESWKAIAAYLGRSEKTVRRWEEKENLPVRRLQHEKRGSVFAFEGELDEWRNSRTLSVERSEPPASGEQQAGSHPARRRAWIAGASVAVASVLAAVALWTLPRQVPARNVAFHRITDSDAREDSPSISPDGRSTAFAGGSAGRRQIWVRLLTGGTPSQVTSDDAGHQEPRWAPDSNSLLYYTPPLNVGDAGTVWEISASGGVPRKVDHALGGGDISHNGREIVLFQSDAAGRTHLTVVPRVGRSGKRDLLEVPAGDRHSRPRWSPDDRWIAFQSDRGDTFEKRVAVIPSQGGAAVEVIRDQDIRGFSWLADGSALVFSSSRGSTVLYPPIFHLRTVRRDGSGDRQLTFGDVSYVDPDWHPSGKLVAAGIHSRGSIWKFAVDGPPAENVRHAVRVTRQIEQAQTPSVSADGRELVYLSDSGGHGNLWIVKTDGSSRRQLTFERDPATAIGVPVWSPVANQIVFLRTRNGQTSQWIIQSDGSGLRQLIPQGIWANWSPDGQWLYYVVARGSDYRIEKIDVRGGPSVVVRSDNAVAPAVGAGSLLYYATILRGPKGVWDFEVRAAEPEGGQFRTLALLAGRRVPVEPMNFHLILSPDGKRLAAPFADGGTTDLWALPVAGGPLRRITDFGGRPVLIARRVAWSPDSKYLYAAVAEVDSELVLLEGILP